MSVTVETGEGGVPASEAPGAFVDVSTAESEKSDRLCWTEVEEEEGRSAGAEVIGWATDVGPWVEKSFARVEDNGTSVEAAASRSRVKAGVRGVSGPAVVLGGGAPLEEVSGGSAGVEVCRSHVSVEARVEL